VTLSIPDQLIQEFKTYNEVQQDALWKQGDLLVEYVEEVWPDAKRSKARKQFFDDFAAAVDLSPAAVRLRFHTSRLFPVEKRAADKTWFYHCLCGKAGKTPEQAEVWLDTALANGWTQTELEAAIKTNTDPKQVEILAKHAPVEFISNDGGILSLQLEKPMEGHCSPSEALVMTLTRPTPETPEGDS